jgi:hypothetical protein
LTYRHTAVPRPSLLNSQKRRPEYTTSYQLPLGRIFGGFLQLVNRAHGGPDDSGAYTIADDHNEY